MKMKILKMILMKIIIMKIRKIIIMKIKIKMKKKNLGIKSQRILL